MGFQKPTLGTTLDWPQQNGRLIDIVEGPAFRNFLRNGDFAIAQRGTSFAGITTAQYTLDGASVAGNGTNTVTREAFTVGQTAVPGNPAYFMRFQRTGAAGGINELFGFPIENPARLSGKTVTFSFWAKVASGSKVIDCDLLSSGVTPTIQTTTQPNTITTTWTLFKYTIAVDAMTAATAASFLKARLTELTAVGTFTLDIADAQLEIGSEATFFERVSPDVQVSRNQRHFVKSFALATAPAQNVGAGSGEMVFIAGKAGAAAEASPRIFFPQAMRAAPTVTLYNPSAANAQVRDATAAADCSSSAAANITESGFHVTATGNASTAVGNILGVHFAATAEV